MARRASKRRLRRASRRARSREPYSAVLVSESEVEAAVDILGEPHPHYRGKSWDLWRGLRVVLDRHPDPATPILDGGASYSPFLEALQDLGYEQLVGCDLVSEGLARGPAISLALADVTRLPFEQESFDVVGSISVLEHGVDVERAMHEWARVLRPGGSLVLSTDYHDPKLSTADVDRSITFGAEWTIFDRPGLTGVIDAATANGLALLDPIEWRDSELPVIWGGRTYTFAFLAFAKPPTA
jgi:SAM-dependent methyltransferase